MTLEGNEMNMDRIAEEHMGLHDEQTTRAMQSHEIDQLRHYLSVALEAMEYAYRNRTSHYAHWDKTGGAGSGCPACQQETENNDRMRRTIDSIRRVYPSLIARLQEDSA